MVWKAAREVERDEEVPFGDREVVDRGDMLHSGIVDQDVERAGLRHHRLDRLGPGQVGVAVAGAELGAELFDLRRVAEAVQDDLRALGGERSGDGEADPGGGAGDEGGLAFEEHGGVRSFDTGLRQA